MTNSFRPQRINTMTALSKARSFVGPTISALFIALVAVVVGGFSALLPASFSARLGFLIAGAVVVLLALLMSAGARAPRAGIRYLLFTWVVVSVVWPHYLTFRGLPGPGVNPIRLVYWSMAALWFFWFVGSKEFRHQLLARLSTFRPFVILLSAYLVWGLICSVFSKLPFVSIYHSIQLMAGPVLIFLVALSCLRDRQDVDRVLLLVVIAAILAVVVGLVEAVKQKNLFYDLVPSLFPQGGEGELSWAEQLIRDKSRDGNYRVMSTFVHPLTFGEYLALSLPLAIFMAGYAVKATRRMIGFIAIPLIFIGLYICHTRSPLLAVGMAVLGLVGSLGVRAVRQRASFSAAIAGFFFLVAVPIAAVALIVVGLEMSAGRTIGEVGSSSARLVMFQRGGTLVFEQPLLGYGPGFAAVTLGFLPGFTSLTIDSYYLSVALESGLPGLLVFFAMLAYPIGKGLATSARIPGIDGARLAVIAVSLLGFAVVKLVLSQPDNLAAVFLMLALLCISLEVGSPAKAERETPTPVRARKWSPEYRD